MANLTKIDIHKKAMIDALEKSLGIVTTACKSIGISRQTHYDWINSDEAYKNAVNDIGEITLDFVESALHKSIQKGSDTATIFYLKTRGKNRGYIERSEITGLNGESVGFVMNLLPPSDATKD